MLRAKFYPESNFSPPIQDKDGNYFLDQNPETFPYVLQYLCSKSVTCLPPIEKHHLIEVLQEEANYFGLDGLVELCKSNSNFGSSTMVVTKNSLCMQAGLDSHTISRSELIMDTKSLGIP